MAESPLALREALSLSRSTKLHTYEKKKHPLCSSLRLSKTWDSLLLLKSLAQVAGLHP